MLAQCWLIRSTQLVHRLFIGDVRFGSSHCSAAFFAYHLLTNQFLDDPDFGRKMIEILATNQDDYYKRYSNSLFDRYHNAPTPRMFSAVFGTMLIPNYNGMNLPLVLHAIASV